MITTKPPHSRSAAKRFPIVVEIDPSAAVLYARVSSKEQELGYSICAQQELLRPYAGEQSMLIHQEFVDVETAKTTGRPGSNAMVAYLKEHPECRVLLVEQGLIPA